MLADVKNRHLTPWIAELFIDLLTSCIAVTVYSIGIHFIYRLLALERQGRLKYFNDQFLLVWFSIPLLAGAIWFAVTRFVFGMNPLTTNYIRNTVEEFFNLKMEDCVYGAAVFYPIDENGHQFVSWKAFFGLACYMTLLTIPFVTILVCGVKSFKKVRSLLDHGESEFARNLQMQLYKALIAQTVIPVFFFFIPFGFIFILPIFEVDCHFLGAPITLVFAMYPAIDPLPTLFFVDYYRNAIFGLLCGCYGVTVCSIAIHFIYRLLALESIPLLAGAIWFAVTIFVFGMNPLTTNYIRNTVEEFFNLKMEDCVYGAAVFYPIDENGHQFVSWKAFFGLACYMTLLTIPFVTILVCGVKSFKKVRSLLDHGESEFARNLQMQLYKALIAQTVIPIFFVFISFGFIFTLPIFEIDCQFLGAPITLVIAMYPVVDPLPTLFFVDYYRNAIFEVFHVCRCKTARIEGASVESMSRGYPNTV
ncbi:hypothetical protein GCK72_013181 [Caenorhabditis remanei]|uniref:Serpentine receptor class r-10 n=1 Tax=Caenorhabditis remanei TaxID=31234 RepID=A0A6A5GN41_CAERE|nr:hypothetical protein GCK72_013181 [Caenorhabditis remanei]KAF1756727.1 hypothetical protein GCK72_013181 [Caenorhabditis remanei]